MNGETEKEASGTGQSKKDPGAKADNGAKNSDNKKETAAEKAKNAQERNARNSKRDPSEKSQPVTESCRTQEVESKKEAPAVATPSPTPRDRPEPMDRYRKGNNYTYPDGRESVIFYDPKEFGDQANSKACDLARSGDMVRMVPVTTESEFVEAWKSLKTDDEVTLVFHGNANAISIDWQKKEYLTTIPNGFTPENAPATFIGSLEKKNLRTLTILSCQNGNIDERYNVARTFSKTQNIGLILAWDGQMSFGSGGNPRFPVIDPENRMKMYLEKYGHKPQGWIYILGVTE